jgi:hypothetical protein
MKVKRDVSGNFKFRWFDRGKYRYHEGTGDLGVPGEVVEHRSPTSQSSVSKGTGDDAGHLIGNRFGASGGIDNLGPQNWRQNRYGTFKDLEDSWAILLQARFAINVCVQDVYREGEDRPFMRRAEWVESSPTGNRSLFELIFANTHTQESREGRDLPPTVSADNHASIIDMFTRRRLWESESGR